jgi:PPM family protein phosphatase
VAIAFEFGAVSDVGSVRHRNEDSAYCSGHLLAVADGVAGGPAGDVASALVIDTLRRVDAATMDTDDPRRPLLSHVELAGDRLAGECQRDPDLAGMATTLTAVLTGRSDERNGRMGGELGLVHVGDSRLYLFHAGQLLPMTRDHSLPELLLEQGHITRAEADRHPQRSTIVRSVSTDADVRPDAVLLFAFDGQRLLLCSDGLSDYVPPGRLSDLVAVGTPQQAANALLEEALGRGSRDNITVVVADVVDREDQTLPPVTLGAAAERETLLTG